MAEAEGVITVHIKSPKEKRSVQVNQDSTIKDLRAAVSKEFSTDTSQLCLIFSGKILKDEETLTALGIKDGLVVHLVIKSPRPAGPGEGSTAAPSAAGASGPSLPNNQTASNPAGGLPLPDLFRVGVESGGGLADMQAHMQREMMRNPQMMRQMLDNPLVQSIMSNPDTMRAMIQSNPQLRDLMDRNPELNSLLNNPEILRQTMELARSPAAMEEMSRNYDRALSNLESVPGGFGHLQRMYRDIQEPMLSATEESMSRNPFASLAGASRPTGTDQQGTENNQPLPNPWAAGSAAGQPQGQGQQSAGGTQQPGFRSLQEQMLQSNPAMLAQAMQAPYMQSMMQALAADPQLAESMLVNSPLVAGNPELQAQMRQMLPQMMAQMSNPQAQAALSNPRALQAIMQIQESMRVLQQEAPGFLPGVVPPTGLSSVAPAAGTQQQPQQQQQQHQHQTDMASLMQSMLGMMASQGVGDAGAGGLQQQQQQQQLPPEQRYASQLEQLASMGFINHEANLRAIQATFGDVNAAIDRLLHSGSQ